MSIQLNPSLFHSKPDRNALQPTERDGRNYMENSLQLWLSPIIEDRLKVLRAVPGGEHDGDDGSHTRDSRTKQEWRILR